ncbi:UDP-N-acetylmuramoyl-L-alanine--D-glutamate ligase [Alteromonas sp. 5E99-2]|uniref:UDP-N-acetylmuramoyl-L-alanine--D-glutamate ligase n=1 Tax=Alteromonas sp. 5E99-2 TaxID=2817683 RepID=UPI001A98300B|nr:UDP-N-acetylmuramoyl-L-alanine--D-glutamate ligase [Alteromonas sp. 5E99-2]MBO1256420.1 UDP-N-acetylmuramoyl-L-alanine--D-glutamate ligase [Alteromonas sp. 5E99-2]
MTIMTSQSPSHSSIWNSLNKKRIVVVGGGKTGLSAVHYLYQQGSLVSLVDGDETKQLNPEIQDCLEDSYFGKNCEIPWSHIDGVVLSPGIAPTNFLLSGAREFNIPIIGDIELFAYGMVARKKSKKTQVPLVGITGSNGKTTVTLLVEHILNSQGKRAIAVGNVGAPALDLLLLPDCDFPDYIVLELSSFQLEMTASLSLEVACYLNLSEDHLDRHSTLKHYNNAKQRIYNNAKSAVYWQDQTYTHPEKQFSINSRISFSVNDNTEHSSWNLNANNDVCYQSNILLAASDVPLSGLHNILNVQAAAAITHELGVSLNVIAERVQTFLAPPHRCITVARNNNIQWIDDSKATNPGATLAALEGIGPLVKGKLILIAGGDAKGADLSLLAPAMNRYVSMVITIGKDAELFQGLAPARLQVDSLDIAVKMAFDMAKSGDIVLLSPACASIDMFDNYVHRAQVFVEAIQRWAA